MAQAPAGKTPAPTSGRPDAGGGSGGPRALTTAGGLKGRLERLAGAAARLCGARCGLIAWRRPGPRPGLWLALAGCAVPEPARLAALEEALAGRCWGRPAVWPEPGFELPPGEPVRSLLTAPIRQGRTTIGLLGLADRRGRDFQEGDLSLAAEVAACAAASLAAAQERRGARRLARRLGAMAAAGRELLASLEREPRPEAVVEAAKRLLGARLAILVVLDEEARLVQGFGDWATACPVDAGLRLASFAAKYLRAHPVIDNRLGAGSFLPPGHVPLTCALGVSLPLGTHHAGCLVLANKPGGFSPEDGRLAALLAPHALVALTGSAEGDQAARVRLAALQEASHELKTPLSALALCHDLLASGRLGPLNERQRQAVEGGRRSLERLRSEHGRLLDLACLRGWQPAQPLRRVDLAALLRESVAAALPLASARGVAVELEAPESLPLQGEPEGLRKVVGNLLSNALKYNRPGGRVSLRAFRDARGIHLVVADTGLGLGQEERAHLFEAFYRGRAAELSGAQGQGLGLFIVRRGIERHRGHIEVESSPGAGTTFTVTLPATPGGPPPGPAD